MLHTETRRYKRYESLALRRALHLGPFATRARARVPSLSFPRAFCAWNEISAYSL